MLPDAFSYIGGLWDVSWLNINSGFLPDAKTDRVANIFLWGYVFEVAGSIIKAVGVRMIHLVTFGTRTDECSGNDTMRQILPWFFFRSSQIAIRIPAIATSRFQDKAYGLMRTGRRAFNTSQAGNGINAFILRHILPDFALQFFGGKFGNSHSAFSPIKSGLIRLGSVLVAPFRAVSILTQNMEVYCG